MKLLVVKLHAIGDLVIATPALRRLRNGFPDGTIHLLTTRYSEPAVRHGDLFDRVITAEDRIFFRPGIASLPATLRLLRAIRAERYDAAVIFHRHKMVDRFTALAGIGRRFRFNGGEDGRSVLLDENRHSALTACELADLAVRALDGVPQPPALLDDQRYEWTVSASEETQAGVVLNEHDLIPGEFAVLVPGGGDNPSFREDVRRWGVSGFAELARLMLDRLGLRTVLVGGPNDSPVCEAVASGSGSHMVNLAGTMDLRASAAVMRLAALVVSNDTGPLHVAAAVGCRVIGIFGPTGVRYKLPPGNNCRGVSLGLPCSPCYFTIFRGCIFDSIRCLERLDVERVYDEVAAVMKSADIRVEQ